MFISEYPILSTNHRHKYIGILVVMQVLLHFSVQGVENILLQDSPKR